MRDRGQDITKHWKKDGVLFAKSQIRTRTTTVALCAVRRDERVGISAMYHARILPGFVHDVLSHRGLELYFVKNTTRKPWKLGEKDAQCRTGQGIRGGWMKKCAEVR